MGCGDRKSAVPLHRQIRDSGKYSSKRYLPRLSKWDVHEWDIMCRFCDTVEDDQLQGRLLHAIHGSNAFRRFKNELDFT